MLSVYHNVIALTGHLLFLLWVVHENICDDEYLIFWRKLNAIPAKN
jgi:hypothetical protein